MTQINVFRKAISSMTSRGFQARRYIVVSLLFLIASFWSAASYALTVTINEFSVDRNGSGFFIDSFTDGVEPPSGPANPNLLPGNAYAVSGTIPDGAESGGVLLLDSANGILTFNAVGNSRRQVATFLRTDTSADNSVGLKSDDTLSLTGIFSLTPPPGPLFSAYGIRFTDSAPGGVVHQFAQLFVRFSETTNQAQIAYVLQDFDPDIITQLGSTLFNPPADADEILLHIENTDANKDNFFGSFSYLQGGLVVGGGSFGTPAILFNDENFVRAQFFVSQDVVVPEPSSIWLLIAGLGGLAVKIRGRRS